MCLAVCINRMYRFRGVHGAHYYSVADSLYSAVQLNGPCAVYFLVDTIGEKCRLHWPCNAFLLTICRFPSWCTFCDHHSYRPLHVTHCFPVSARIFYFFNRASKLIRIVVHKDLGCAMTTIWCSDIGLCSLGIVEKSPGVHWTIQTTIGTLHACRLTLLLFPHSHTQQKVVLAKQWSKHFFSNFYSVLLRKPLWAHMDIID